jgi:hypothetical protein
VSFAHQSEFDWFLGLRAVDRARFLSLVSHDLTVAARGLTFRGHPETQEPRIEMLRELNELQHQLSGYISYALGPDEDVRFLPSVVRRLLEARNEYVRDSANRAWYTHRSQYVPVA